MKISTQKLETIMVEKRLSLQRLSEASGISRQSLATIRNRGTCQIGTAAKLCAGLGCTIKEITPTESEE